MAYSSKLLQKIKKKKSRKCKVEIASKYYKTMEVYADIQVLWRIMFTVAFFLTYDLSV